MRPVLIELGPLVIRYYGVMYVIAFTVGLYLAWIGVKVRRLAKVRSNRARERTFENLRSILERSFSGSLRERVIGLLGADEVADAIADAVVGASARILTSASEPKLEVARRAVRSAIVEVEGAEVDAIAADRDGLVDAIGAAVYRRWNLHALVREGAVALDGVGCETIERMAFLIDAAVVRFLRKNWRYHWNLEEIEGLRVTLARSLRDAYGAPAGGDVLTEEELLSVAREVAPQILFVWDDAVDLLLWTIPCAILGARIYYVVFRWDVYRANPIDVFKIWEGGLAIHGGVLVGALTVYLFARWKGVRFWAVTDILAPSLILGQAIGRIGNLMNGDAFGTPTTLPWGIRFPAESPAGRVYPGQATHPSMVYEMILNLMIFAYLWSIRKRGYKDGFATAMYFILYAIARSIVSFTRGDSLWLGPIRAAHAISAVFVVGFGVLIWRRRLYERSSTA